MLKSVENTVEKRRNCPLRGISFFPNMFSRLSLQTLKNKGFFGKGLTLTMLEPSYVAFADGADQDQTAKNMQSDL